MVFNADGKRLLSRRVMNDETELLQLIEELARHRVDVLWAAIRDRAPFQAAPVRARAA